MRVTGLVKTGEGKGKAMGSPTANLDVAVDLEPGVYAAWTHHLDTRLESVVCYGVRDPAGKQKFEVHILDYAGDLYGRELSVEIIGERLSGLQDLTHDEMVKKIESDIRLARAALKHYV